MNAMLETAKQSLESLGYTVRVFATGKEAADYLCGEIQNTTVGFGGSMTLAALGLPDRLKENNTVLSHWNVPAGESADEVRRRAMSTEVYLCSVNGLSVNGEIVNIDGTGNRVAGAIFGHQRVYFVVGKNKLAENYEAALWRARNIAAPKNAQRLHRKTPCAALGDRCYNCKSPERICRALTVLWEAPSACRYEVVLVDEELGY